MKYFGVLAVALFAFASVSHAQSVDFLGGGSSALFLELGQAAVTEFPATDVCIWTSNALASNDVAARDTRPATADVQNGKVWVVWNKNGGANCGNPTIGAGFRVLSYMSVDSVIGDRCYFAAFGGASGCIAVYTPTQTEGNAGNNLLLQSGSFGDSPSTAVCAGTNSPCIIPTTVTALLNNQRWFAAGTDVLPTDAKFATFRALTSCTTNVPRAPFGGGLTVTTGLGYNVNGPQVGVGEAIKSFYSAPTFSVVDFNISGTDPFSGQAVPGFSVNTVGAQPIVVAVGPAGGTGLGAATDINTFTLTLFYNGTTGRATDLLGPTVNPGLLEVLVREPLSGTFNTFEYSIPNSNQFHTSQENANCNTATGAEGTNPFNQQSGNGVPLAARRRVLGTGEMVATIQGATSADQRMGYFFWSAANGKNFTATNGKYLTVNGVDPLLDNYNEILGPTGVNCGTGTTPNAGLIPTGGNLACITFKGLNQGDYPVWSALRIVSTNPAPAGVTNLIAAAQTLNSTQQDFIPLSRLNVWHSHFALPVIGVNAAALGPTINPATPNDLCTAGALPELGGDAGGANVLKVANHDFCSDFSNTTGLINASN